MLNSTIKKILFFLKKKITPRYSNFLHIDCSLGLNLKENPSAFLVLKTKALEFKKRNQISIIALCIHKSHLNYLEDLLHWWLMNPDIGLIKSNSFNQLLRTETHEHISRMV